jgi:hypothetical protein
MRKRIVLFVEGYGDHAAAPILIQRLLWQNWGNDIAFVDPSPYMVGELAKITGKNVRKWERYLLAAAAQHRDDLGGVLLLLDGDCTEMRLDNPKVVLPFCIQTAAWFLAEHVQELALGKQFSVGVAFASREYESWIISAIESLVGKRLADGREILSQLPQSIPPNPEQFPRGAKEWLRSHLSIKYDAAAHQAELTRLVDWDVVSKRNLRSFRHLTTVVGSLVTAIRQGQPIVTPLRRPST